MSTFPLASFLITLLLAAAVCTHGGEPVTDTDGKEVRINEQYFIQPVNTELSRGGLVPLAARVANCPLGITGALPGDSGVPVSIAFPPTYPTDSPVVNTSFPVTIQFKFNACEDLSKFWEVDELPPHPTHPEILIDGRPKEQSSRFEIEKVGEVDNVNIYKFTTPSRTVGVPTGSNRNALQLVLTSDVEDTTIAVKFIKVNNAPTDVTSRVEKLGLRMIPFY